MKKLLILAAAMLLSVSTNGMNTIGIGADTIRINPNRLTGYWQVPVVMDIDGYADTWQVSITYPGGVLPKLVAGITAMDGMTITYTSQTGALMMYEAPLQVSTYYQTISSSVAGTYGYWDYNFDGIYETYGNIKWEPGRHELWEFNLSIPEDFRAGYIVFDGTISSGYDARGAILSNVKTYRRTWLWVGYIPGDVSGNDRLGIDDVTMLIDYLLGDDTLDEFQAAACDVNGDGAATIRDTTALIDMLL